MLTSSETFTQHYFVCKINKFISEIILSWKCYSKKKKSNFRTLQDCLKHLDNNKNGNIIYDLNAITVKLWCVIRFPFHCLLGVRGGKQIATLYREILNLLELYREWKYLEVMKNEVCFYVNKKYLMRMIKLINGLK